MGNWAYDDTGGGVTTWTVWGERKPPWSIVIDAPTDPRTNQLLAALPDGEWLRWQPYLEQVTMPLGQVLYEPGATLGHVYFPTNSIVSLLYVMSNGASAEIAVVGHEGIVGISLFMG